jgi:ATP phosphoribosyltransferase regulatory subunit HisZ
MSANYEDKARALANRVAQRLAAPAGEVSELRAELSAALQRINQLETQLQTQHPTPNAQRLSLHPSQERFNIEPAIAEMVDYLEGVKRCGFEPGNKPCDNCAMCTARGF